MPFQSFIRFVLRHMVAAWATVILFPLFIVLPLQPWMPEEDGLDIYKMLAVILMVWVPLVVIPCVMTGEFFQHKRRGRRITSWLLTMMLSLILPALLLHRAPDKLDETWPLLALAIVPVNFYWVACNFADVFILRGLVWCERKWFPPPVVDPNASVKP